MWEQWSSKGMGEQVWWIHLGKYHTPNTLRSYLLPGSSFTQTLKFHSPPFPITRGTKTPPDLQYNTAKDSLTCWHCSFLVPCFEGVSYNMFKKRKWTVLCKSQDSRNWSIQKKKNTTEQPETLDKSWNLAGPIWQCLFFFPQSCTMLNIRSKQFSLADTGSALHSPSP